MLQMSKVEFLGLKCIISGGQDGADLAGVETARQYGIPTGGTIPLGYRTNSGCKPYYRELYNIVEDTSYSYVPRTKLNIRNSTGTVIIASNLNSPGCSLTSTGCNTYNKPCLSILISQSMSNDEIINCAKRLVKFIKNKRIEILNVAGNRDFYPNTLHFDTVNLILSIAIEELQSLNLIRSNTHESSC